MKTSKNLRNAVALVITVFILPSLCLPQNLDDLIPEGKVTPKQNTGMLFGGLAIQTLGLGLTAGTVYVMIHDEEVPEEVYNSGLSVGLMFTVGGSAMIIISARNMAMARKSVRDMKKERRKTDLTISIESTSNGIGIVCRF